MISSRTESLALSAMLLNAQFTTGQSSDAIVSATALSCQSPCSSASMLQSSTISGWSKYAKTYQTKRSQNCQV